LRCIAISEFGGADRLRPMDLPRPRPGKNEILIRVVAAGVDPFDVDAREGRLREHIPHDFPLIPGWDAAGVVEELGESASRFRKGDRVWTYALKQTLQWGCYAEFLAVAEEHVAPMPTRLLYEEAAAVPRAGLTALQCLRTFPGYPSAIDVLVHDAHGGVGHFAVQLARNAGARVIGTTCAAHQAFVLSQGAVATIDVEREDLVEAARRHFPDGFDLVVDTVGGDAQARSLDLLKPGGRIASTVAPDPEAAPGAPVEHLFGESSGVQLHALAQLVDAGKLRPHVDRIFSLSAAAEAHDHVESCSGPGRVVLNL
jgi:NADPH:quinone reductase-like Zn-dependent oxidoreductase